MLGQRGAVVSADVRRRRPKLSVPLRRLAPPRGDPCIPPVQCPRSKQVPCHRSGMSPIRPSLAARESVAGCDSRRARHGGGLAASWASRTLPSRMPGPCPRGTESSLPVHGPLACRDEPGGLAAPRSGRPQGTSRSRSLRTRQPDPGPEGSRSRPCPGCPGQVLGGHCARLRRQTPERASMVRVFLETSVQAEPLRPPLLASRASPGTVGRRRKLNGQSPCAIQGVKVDRANVKAPSGRAPACALPAPAVALRVRPDATPDSVALRLLPAATQDSPP